MSASIKIGILTIGYGPYSGMGEDGLRGVKIAVEGFSGLVAGRPIQLVVKSTDASPQRTLDMLEELILDDAVDLVIGPLSGNEGLATRNFANENPGKVFINGSAGAQEMTMHDGAPNFFSFSPNGVQMIAGLGHYAYHQLGLRRVVTIGEDYSFPYAQIGGFMAEFCTAGGEIIKKLWVPLGTDDYAPLIAQIPDEADAILVLLGGTDAIQFIRQYEASGKTKPMLGGTIAADQTVLSRSDPKTGVLQGMITCGPTADDYASKGWKTFVETYREMFPQALNYPSLFPALYYLNTHAALLALEHVKGDATPSALIPALTTLKFEGPMGAVALDRHRQAITTNFVATVARSNQGVLYRKQLQIATDVSQTLGMPEDKYLALGWFTRDNPTCAQFG